MGTRFAFGGDATNDQRVYFFNTKEIMDNKYGTASPVPFPRRRQQHRLDVRHLGSLQRRILVQDRRPTHVLQERVRQRRGALHARQNRLAAEKSSCSRRFSPAFAKISAMGVRYSAVPAHTTDGAKALNEVLSQEWTDLRGIQVASFGVNSIAASPEDEAMIKELQKAAVMRDPSMAAANLAASQADAMRMAASNENGAMMGFMGMGMANAVAA